MESSLGFIAVRVLQGFGVLGTGLLGLALVGELASRSTRANVIGKYNSFRFAAGIAGTLGAGALYELYGFRVVFGLLAVLLAVATVGVWWFIDPDESSVGGFAFADLAFNRRITSSIGIRSIVWRPGGLGAPILGGYLMTEVGMEWMFFLGGVAALSGALTFFGVLSYTHGRPTLTKW